MTYREAIKNGIKAVNKNHQLLLIQTGALILAFFLFILIVGVPAIIIFTKAGFELPEEGFRDFLKSILNQGFKTYLSIFITIMLSLLIYILIASFIVIYSIAGSSGILMSYITGKGGYSWGLFHTYGKRFFKRFLFLSLAGLVSLLLLSFIAGLLSGLTKAVPVSSLIDENFLKDFITNFFNLLSVFLSLGMVIFFMAIFTYAAGLLLLKEPSSRTSASAVLEVLKEAWVFIIKKPESLLFYGLLSLGAIMLTLFFGIIGTIFKGPGGFILYQLTLSVIQIYINLSVISCAFVYLKESL